MLGFGSTGRQLTTYINQTRPDVAQIVVACDVAQPQLDLAKETYGLVTTPSAAELIAMDLDFVLVASSNHAHAGQVVMAAEAGKHIFCEKPIALSLTEADRMIAAVETAGVVNVVNNNNFPAFSFFSFLSLPLSLSYLLLKLSNLFTHLITNC